MGVRDADQMRMADAEAGAGLAVQQLDGGGLIVPLVAHDLDGAGASVGRVAGGVYGRHGTAAEVFEQFVAGNGWGRPHRMGPCWKVDAKRTDAEASEMLSAVRFAANNKIRCGLFSRSNRSCELMLGRYLSSSAGVGVPFLARARAGSNAEALAAHARGNLQGQRRLGRSRRPARVRRRRDGGHSLRHVGQPLVSDRRGTLRRVGQEDAAGPRRLAGARRPRHPRPFGVHGLLQGRPSAKAHPRSEKDRAAAFPQSDRAAAAVRRLRRRLRRRRSRSSSTRRGRANIRPSPSPNRT